MLKLYTVPRHKQQQQKYVLKNGSYKSLRDCEKGQYGVLSITNPNYEDGAPEDDRQQQNDEAGLSDEEEDVDIFKSDSLTVQHPLTVWRTSQEVICSEDNAVGSNCQVMAPSAPHCSSIRMGIATDTLLASGSDCDKSFSCSGNVEQELEEEGDRVGDLEDRILPPSTIKGSHSEGASGATAGDLAPAAKNNKNSIQTMGPSHGKLSGALRISELARRPLPSAV